MRQICCDFAINRNGHANPMCAPNTLAVCAARRNVCARHICAALRMGCAMPSCLRNVAQLCAIPFHGPNEAHFIHIHWKLKQISPSRRCSRPQTIKINCSKACFNVKMGPVQVHAASKSKLLHSERLRLLLQMPPDNAQAFFLGENT